MIWPPHGHMTCRKHGASTRQAKEAARLRLAEGAALKALQDVDVTPIGNPIEALIELTSKARAFMDWSAERVAALGEAIRFEDAKGTEQLRAEVALYERAIDRTQKFLVDWARLGLDERLVRVNEQQGQLIADIFRRVLEDPELGLDERQREVGRGVAARHLQVLSSSA